MWCWSHSVEIRPHVGSSLSGYWGVLGRAVGNSSVSLVIKGQTGAKLWYSVYAIKQMHFLPVVFPTYDLFQLNPRKVTSLFSYRTSVLRMNKFFHFKAFVEWVLLPRQDFRNRMSSGEENSPKPTRPSSPRSRAVFVLPNIISCLVPI